MSRPPKIPIVDKLEHKQPQVSKLLQQGLTFHQQGNLTEAQVIYEQILNIQPDHFDALQLLGVLSAQIKKYSKAVEFLSKALQINPKHAKVCNNYGIALKELKRFDEAIASYDQAIAINPDYIDALSNRGNALQELNRYDEAVASYDQAIAIKSDYAEAHFNRGNALQELNRYDEAVASYDQAIAIKSDYAEAYSNRGVSLKELNRYEEALTSYNQAIAIKPNHIDANLNLSLCNLMLGNFNEGWQGFEWRWLDNKFDSKPLKSNKPAWDHQKTDQRLLVWPEQGIGDHIFFGSLLSELLEDTPHLLVQIDRRLIPIFKRSLPKIKFYPNNIAVPESEYEVHAPIGSFGKYLRNDEKDFESSRYGFLKDDEIKTANIKKDLLALTPSNNKICGISWRSVRPKTGIHKTISLKFFIETLALEGYTFVSLQYGDTADEIKEVKDELGIDIISYEKVDNFNDIDGLASLIQACDTVISVDNVTCQLAGALGKEISILLHSGPWWGWMANRSDSPWYSSVKLYRQEKINNWGDVLEKVRGDL
jgi:tetratricopeptide (TPR) repeat protein/ADP-heptose:LPS heptosyltransferase